MQTKQSIAIIGAEGNMGSAIAKGLASGNYRLLLKSNNARKLQALTKEIRASVPTVDLVPMECSKDACWEADMIILAIPYVLQKEMAQKIRDFANQKIVISIANRYSENGQEPGTAPAASVADELQKILPHSRIVKVFNTIPADGFTKPAGDRKQIDAFIAGNIDDDLRDVSALIRAAGFNPAISGDLSMSLRLENMPSQQSH
jgi:predicted dinucleotide-binding enzyme